MSNNQNIDSANPTEEQLAALVLDHYLAGPDHEAEPDPVADARFIRYVRAAADDEFQAALAYLAEAGVEPFIHEFLAKHGVEASFADLANFIQAQQNQ